MAASGGSFQDEWERQRLDQEAFAEGEWPSVFGSGSNRCLTGSASYLGFKAVEALIVTGITGWSLYDRFVTKGCGDKYLIYLTHWSLVLQVYYVWISLWAAYRTRSAADYERMPMSVGTAWVLADISLPLSLLVCVLYWGLIFPHQGLPFPPDTLEFLTHGANFLIMLLDTFISRTPHHLLHGVYFAGVCASYVLFSLLYWVLDGRDCSNNRYVLHLLAWDDVGSWTAPLLKGLLLFTIFPMVCLVCFYLYAVVVGFPYREDGVGAGNSWSARSRRANGACCGCGGK